MTTALSRREFARRTLAAVGGMAAGPWAWSAAASAARPAAQTADAIDPLTLVHPDLREIAAALASPGAREARRRDRASAVPAGREPESRVIPGPSGAPDVRVEIADPAPGAEGRPAMLHLHGGGYVAGTAEARHDWAESCGCVMVSVDYRLAPATPFPGSLEDNYAALRWVHANAEALGVDRSRIAIVGSSAGGGHAAALAIAARDRGEVPVMFQVLIYPMLDDRTGSSRPVPPHIGTLVWTSESNRAGWEALLGQPAGLPTVPPGSVPARVEDLSGLPPAWIGVGDIDLFVEENIEYARRLIKAAVPVQLEVVPGAFHGFPVIAPDAGVSVAFTERWQTALRHAFESAGA